jgi:outer membrane protein assembly factor BamB
MSAGFMQILIKQFRFALVLGFCSLPVFLGAAPGDWPQWRGPNRDDISSETGLLQDWPPSGPLLVWKATGLGEGYSTVSVLGQRIFTIGEKGNASLVTALQAADGQSVWTAKLGKPGAPGGYGGPRSTPTVDGDLLYAVGQWGEMVCLETATGKEHWRKDFTKDFGGIRPGWGFAESPLVDGDKVIITPGGSQGSIVALNKDTGALAWRSKEFTEPPQYASLITAEIGGIRQYIQLTAGSVVGIAAADGKLLWRAPRRGDVAVIPTPIYHDGYVYVTSGYGVGCNLFRITESGGNFSAKEVYSNKVMVNHHGGAVLVGDSVYGHSDSKGWTCQDFKTGRAQWQDKDKLGKGSLTYADGRLYLRQEDKPGTVALIEASPAGYKEHGRFDPPARSDKESWPHPVISHGRLYLRDQDVLLCYDVAGK